MPIHFQVSRRALLDTFFRAGAGNAKTRKANARITLAEGVLTITSIGGSEGLRVESLETFDSGYVVLNTARVAMNLPDDDPLPVRLAPKALQFGSIRFRLRAVDPKAPSDEAGRIEAAADILAGYSVNKFDLAFLIIEKPCKFTAQEQPLIDAIAKAWALLAPLGITPDDLKLLVNEKLRSSWTQSAQK